MKYNKWLDEEFYATVRKPHRIDESVWFELGYTIDQETIDRLPGMSQTPLHRARPSSDGNIVEFRILKPIDIVFSLYLTIDGKTIPQKNTYYHAVYEMPWMAEFVRGSDDYNRALDFAGIPRDYCVEHKLPQPVVLPPTLPQLSLMFVDDARALLDRFTKSADLFLNQR